MARNPCPVISVLSNPMFRNAVRTALLLIGRCDDRLLGNKYRLRPENCRSDFKTSIAWRDRGTICGCFIFIFSAGIDQIRTSRSNSDHSAFRSSPGRTKNMAASCRAHLTTNDPRYPSMACRSGATSFGSVSAARWLDLYGGNAPFRSAAGSRSALPVATAYLKTWPQMVLTRCAVSSAPLDSMRRSMASSSGGLIFPTGLSPMTGKTSRSSLLRVVSA